MKKPRSTSQPYHTRSSTCAIITCSCSLQASAMDSDHHHRLIRQTAIAALAIALEQNIRLEEMICRATLQLQRDQRRRERRAQRERERRYINSRPTRWACSVFLYLLLEVSSLRVCLLLQGETRYSQHNCTKRKQCRAFFRL